MGAYNSKAEAAVYAKTHGDDEESLKQNKEEVMKTIDHEDLVFDKTPLSIGSAHSYDEMWVEIPKNTAIPTKKFEFVTFTASDNQETMAIAFYQGERTRASDNKLLGALEFKGIPPAPRGVAKITVSVDIDAKGNLNVSAEDRSTGRMETMSIPGVGVRGKLLSAEEVVEMARQGEKHKSEDDEYLMKVIVMKVMKEYTMKIRENAAAGAYSRKAEDEFRVVAEKMLDELKEKAKDFGLEGDACVKPS